MSTALTSWMLYTAAVGALLGVAALIAEAALRQIGRPTRWVWLGALAGSVLIPLATLAGLPSWLRPATPLPEAALIALPPLVVGAEANGGGYSPDALLLWSWSATSLLLGGLVALSFARLWLARRTWRRTAVEGVEVLLTRDVGPAALGGAILLPEWALAVDARMRRLMLLHEEEHVRAHDPSIALAALLFVVALPWNVALWWQLGRLRLAMELDCDARVLRREPDAHLYGTLLLEVGRRRGGTRLVVAFSEPRGFLERRIRAVVRHVAPSWRRATLLGGVAMLVVVLAVCAGDPLRPSSIADVELPAAEPAIAPDREAGVVVEATPSRAGVLEDGPVFTPMTVAPELRNREAVAQALSEAYPPLLSEAGIGGNPTVWFLIDANGTVTRTLLNRSSGYEALDSAALRVARTMEFTPALNRAERVPVWVSIPIVFQARDAAGADTERRSIRERIPNPPPPASPAEAFRSAADAVARLPSPAPPGGAGGGPTFTPMTVAPELRNRAEVARALEESYPPLLRAAGVGGEPTVWLHIDESGRVLETRLNRSSGQPALDDAALRVAGVMAFTPAMNRDRRTAVWVSIPIIFRAEAPGD